MLAKAEAAFFAIADISGYTNFLAAVELDHAQDIIADFMDMVVKGLRPPFRLAKFEGDAAFVFTTDEKVDGSLLQDAIEGAISGSVGACAAFARPRPANAGPASRWAISISNSSSITARW
jgi:class 3 adenylate cyclase